MNLIISLPPSPYSYLVFSQVAEVPERSFLERPIVFIPDQLALVMHYFNAVKECTFLVAQSWLCLCSDHCACLIFKHFLWPRTVLKPSVPHTVGWSVLNTELWATCREDSVITYKHIKPLSRHFSSLRMGPVARRMRAWLEVKLIINLGQCPQLVPYMWVRVGDSEAGRGEGSRAVLWRIGRIQKSRKYKIYLNQSDIHT